MKTFTDCIDAGKASSTEALALFDRLDSVEPDFMIGAWRGEAFPTDHPMDGLLQAYHWHGKRFDNPEEVHPLMFSAGDGRLRSIDPVLLLPIIGLLTRGSLPKAGLLPKIFRMLMPLLGTRSSRARLRVTRFRERDSATMIYDHLPINDIFRKVDDKTVLGVMDLKRMKQPFFFVLRREHGQSSTTHPPGPTE